MISLLIRLFGRNGKTTQISAQATEDSVQMKKFLIACLGNMAPEYTDTRHNSGFMVADELARQAGVQFTSRRYGDIATIRVKKCELLVLKPSTFMNLSGQAVRYWMNQEKLPLDHLLVVVDDIALPFGTLRMRRQGSDAGHNGLKNIAEQLGSTAYSRLRFGVGNDFPKGGQINFVLGKFPPDEMKLIPEVLERAADAVRTFCLAGPDMAMNRFNH